LIIKSKKIQKPQILTMNKPYVSTVLSNEDDNNPSIMDGLFAKLDLYNTSAAEASKIADAKQASLWSSCGIDEHISAAETRDTANVAETRKAREAQAQQGLFSQLRLHMSTLKSPFNRNDTPAPVEVSLDETPRTGMTQHANNLFDGLYHNHPIDGGMEFNGMQTPNHNPLMPIPKSPAATNRTVNFKINNHDDSNTPTRNFNFGEKENPYPRFNAGIDNIATENPLRPNNQVHPDTNQVHPVHTPAHATLPYAPAYTQVDPIYAHAHPQPPL
jgi:hypothetical protein